ncbi:MAG: NAD(P)-dependent oxidoreductase [Bryobacterales bacterium]|nr:NAD(P)-dependent oxidoreductase [Bryobacteraceae bacterium]MDW8354218.1 NAD(P)-dependent oxidoreductase [Bryobacterales bacterium]
MIPRSEQELEDLLSRPSEADREAARDWSGDLLILGAGGKMGPTLARRARRAADEAGVSLRVIAVARFSDPAVREKLERWGVETLTADLLDEEQLAALPDAPNVVFMAARKFGSTGDEPLTWALNTYLPARVAVRFRHSRIVAFSSGNVYPLVPVISGGATEATPPDPIGEYAQSVLGRERMFQYFSQLYGTPVVLLRLNYAVELRYGVLLDIGLKVFERRPVDLSMGAVNVIWQGDANSVCLRAFRLAASPPEILNVTGPETLSVRWIARRFGEHFGVEPVFEGTEAPTALLNNAAHCHRLFGYPSVSAEQMIEWVAQWIAAGGRILGKPTHFEVRDGKF